MLMCHKTKLLLTIMIYIFIQIYITIALNVF